MPTFIMHVQYLPDSIRPRESVERIERKFIDLILSEFPSIEWKNVKILRAGEYLETFRAPDLKTANEIAKLINTSERAQAQVWKAN
jgi:hypothetical protein